MQGSQAGTEGLLQREPHAHDRFYVRCSTLIKLDFPQPSYSAPAPVIISAITYGRRAQTLQSNSWMSHYMLPGAHTLAPRPGQKRMLFQKIVALAEWSHAGRAGHWSLVIGEIDLNICAHGLASRSGLCSLYDSWSL